MLSCVLLVLLSAVAAGGAEIVLPEDGAFPAIVSGGERVVPIAYASYLGGEEHYREAAGTGIGLFVFPAFLGDRGVNPHSGIGAFRSPIWRGPGDYDFSPIAADFDRVLRADPDARVIVRLYLDPPAWWEAAHPEGACQLPGGTTYRQCVVSPLWREETAEVVRRVVRWLLESPYAPHLLGIHLSAGHTEEWFYHYRGAFHDLNPARTESFRAWLRAAYQDNEAELRRAWQDDTVTFGTAAPADISGADRAERWRTASERPVIDTFRFHSDAMVDTITYFACIVKDESEGRLLAGAFYGYHVFVTDPRHGHGALAKLLRQPEVDFLASPNSYNRNLGEDWPPMAPVDSIRLHGKLWMAENDTRTAATTLLRDRAPQLTPAEDPYSRGVWLGPDSIADSVALLRKDLARMLTHGYGGWWFDMWGGWYSHPELLAVLGQSQRLARIATGNGGPAWPAQVALMVDEEMPFQDASFGVMSQQILANRLVLPRCGAPHDVYLRSDWQALPWEQYRLVWLLAPSPPTAEELAALPRADGSTAALLATTPEGTVLMRDGRSTRVVAGLRPLGPSELRPILADAGVHIYLDTDDILYVGRGWAGIHTVSGGDRTLHLPAAARVEDALTGATLHAEGTDVRLHLPPRSTAILCIRADRDLPPESESGAQ